VITWFCVTLSFGFLNGVCKMAVEIVIRWTRDKIMLLKVCYRPIQRVLLLSLESSSKISKPQNIPKGLKQKKKREAGYCSSRWKYKNRYLETLSSSNIYFLIILILLIFDFSRQKDTISTIFFLFGNTDFTNIWIFAPKRCNFDHFYSFLGMLSLLMFEFSCQKDAILTIYFYF